MNKEEIAEQWLDRKYHPASENRPKAKEAFIAGYEAKDAEDKWISVAIRIGTY